MPFNENMNILRDNPGIEIRVDPISGDLNIISKLDDEPNDVGGMTSTELKHEFDKAGLTIQQYINETLIPQVVGQGNVEANRVKAEADRVAAEQGRVTAEEGRASAESERVTAEQQRVEAEQARADRDTGIVAQATAQADAAAQSARDAAASQQAAGTSEANAAASAQTATDQAQTATDQAAAAVGSAGAAAASAQSAAASQQSAGESRTAAAKSAQDAADIAAALSAVLVPKPSVQTVGDLPPDGNKLGDTRYVISTKTFYTWYSIEGVEQWVQLSDPVDLSGLLQRPEIPGTAGDFLALGSDNLPVWRDLKKGKAGGVAPLGPDSKVPLANLPEMPPAFTPVLRVTVETGAEVTATDGVKVVTGTSASGVCELAVPNFGRWTVQAKLGGKTSGKQIVDVSEIKAYALKLSFTTIYGVEWDGTATTSWARTDMASGFVDPSPAINNGSGSSPFDDKMPWAGMRRVSDPQAGELVEIPKYWFKWTKSGNRLKLQIADGPAPGFHVSPGHADRGDGKGERDKIYVGRYHCAGSGWKSQTGQQPHVRITRSAANSGVHTLGGTVWMMDWATRWTIELLYLVEFADWNSQKTIGKGCGDGSLGTMGYTDGMGYHTGTTKGSRDTGGLGTQYRWIEGLWDNCYDWLGGCYYNGSGLNVIMNPAQYSDTSGGTVIGLPVGGWSSKFDLSTKPGYEWCIWPTEANGSETTYLSDFWSFSSGYPCLRVGGYYNVGGNRGMFCVDYDSAPSSSGNVGCRLQKLP